MMPTTQSFSIHPRTTRDCHACCVIDATAMQLALRSRAEKITHHAPAVM
jgi:hypothetical protein